LKTRFTSGAGDVVQPDRTVTFAECCVREGLCEARRQPQLVADHRRIHRIPIVVADRSPGTFIKDFNAAFVVAVSIHQAEVAAPAAWCGVVVVSTTRSAVIVVSTACALVIGAVVDAVWRNTRTQNPDKGGEQ
jgi:fructose-specific phosphotransferase system IIC component